MATLTVKFEGGCLFVIGREGIDACFLEHEHHRVELTAADRRTDGGLRFEGHKARIGGFVLELKRDGFPPVGGQDRIDGAIIDLARVARGGVLRGGLTTGTGGPHRLLDARVRLPRGTLAATFTLPALRYTWDVPGFGHDVCLADGADFTIETGEQDVRFETRRDDGSDQLVLGARAGDNVTIAFVTEETSETKVNPGLGFRLAEFEILYGALERNPSGKEAAPWPVPTLRGERLLSSQGKADLSSLTRNGKPICPIGRINA